MAWWSRLFGKEESKSVFLEPELAAAINGGWGLQTKSGVQVSLNSSLMTTAFYRGVMALAEGVAQLPVEIYKRSHNRKTSEPAYDHPLYDVLFHQASNLQDSYQFFRTMLMHTAAAGNGVAYKNIVNGQVRELIPVRPECVSIDIESVFYNRYYDLTFEKGGYARVGQDQVFHIAGPSWSHYKGLDPSVVGREALGLAKATEETHASLHKNGARPSGVLKSTQKLDDVQLARLKKSWTETFTGTSNVGGTPILFGGLEWQQVQQKGVDSEHLATRKHQIEEIARLLGVFPIMLGHAGDQTPTFASADAFLEAHVRYSLQPLIKAVRSAVDTQLLTKDERDAGYFCRIDTSELLRGSLKDRTEYYKAALGTNSSPGWVSPNEVRTDDGWNPDPNEDMDQVWQPATMTPADDLEENEAETDDPKSPGSTPATNAKPGEEAK